MKLLISTPAALQAAPSVKGMKLLSQNLGSVVGGEAAVRAANFVVVLFIAREYGKATLGMYGVTLAVVTVVVMFADSGLQTAAITRLSVSTANRKEIAARLIVSKTIVLSVVTIVLAGIAIFTKQGPLFLWIGAWLTARTILQSYSQLQMAILKSISKANWIGPIQCVHGCVLLAGIGLVFLGGWSVLVLLGWLTCGQLFEFAMATIVLIQNGIGPSWPPRLDFLATIRTAAPYGLLYGLANAIIRSDTIVLAALVSLDELGAFAAANAILLMVYVYAWLLSSVLLPEMVRLSDDPESLRTYAHQWMRWVLLIALPCALFVAVLAPRAMLVLYGPAFATSGMLGAIMAIACPFILANSIYTAISIAANSRAIFLGVYGGGALATVVLDVSLGRTFGAFGIASAIVIREAGTLLVFWFLISRAPWLAGRLALRMYSRGN